MECQLTHVHLENGRQTDVCVFVCPNPVDAKIRILVHGQVTIIFIVSVCLFLCLSLCAEFFSAVFDPIWIKLGHMLHVRV